MIAIGARLFGLVGVYRTHNHIKLTLRIADSLCIKWTRAKKGVSETKPAFEQLSDSLEASLIEEWTGLERVAMEERGDHLKIYVVRSDKCARFLYWYLGFGVLIVISANTGGHAPTVIGNRGAAGESIRCSVHTDGGPCN